MKLLKTLLTIATITGATFLSSCTPVANPQAAYDAYDRPATLPTNPSKVRVKVSIKNQLAYVMEGNKPLLIMPVTVGTAQNPTPKGTFRIYKKEHKRRAYTHGYCTKGDKVMPCYLKKKPAGWGFVGTPMPYWSEFKPAYGFHTGWMKPFPASHGCLRMHKNVAPKFFRLIREGTIVNIANTQPEDLTIGRDIPRPPDSTPFPGNPDKMMITNKLFNMHKTPTYQ